MTVHFIGAGPGAVDLITLRGHKLLSEADVVIHAGSLVNPAVLGYVKPECQLHDSAKMTLDEVLTVISAAEASGLTTVRLHSGDPSLYGAIGEQMRQLDALGIDYDICPGVSSFSGAAAALQVEYTVPEITQSVVITRMPGRTPMPDGESMAGFASHGSTMVIFLSTGLLDGLVTELIAGGRSADDPAAIVFKATWPEQKIFPCTIGTLATTAAANNLQNTALIVVGPCLSDSETLSRLYADDFATGFREIKH